MSEHASPSSSSPLSSSPLSQGEPVRGSGRPFLIAVLVALAFGIPTLGSGFLFDDWSLLAIIEGRFAGAHTGFDIYRFIGGPADVKALTAHGPFPWFLAPELKLALFRPLSAALMGLDARLFGHHPFGWHVHSVLWYVALVVAAGLLLRRLYSGTVLLVSLVLFAASDSHVMALGWISNRHSEIAVALGFLALWAHLGAREAGWRLGALLSPLLYAGALLASETGLGVLGYFVAFELLGRSDSRAARVRALAPVFGLALVYLGVYKLGGYGTQHSGSYIDPIGEPGSFLLAVPGRLLSLIGSFFLGPPADLQQQVRAVPWLWPLLGVLALVLVAALVRPAVAAMPEPERRSLRWLIVGALLSFAPSLGAMPGSRLLIVPSLGGAVVAAVILQRAWQRRAGALRKLAFGGLFFLLALRPALTFAASLQALHRYAAKLPELARDSELPARAGLRVLVPVAPDFITAVYVPTVRLVLGLELPRDWWVLSLSPRDHILTRTAADRIELAPVGGPMLETPFERLFRSAAVPFHPGEVVQTSGMTVRVLEVADGAPTRIEAQFDRPLDDPDVWCLEWREGLLRKLTLPKVGESVRIAHQRGPFGI